MRNDILIKDAFGQEQISISKAIGKNYGNFWFTNNKCRYRLLKGSRNSKKSKVTSYEIIMKIISDERRNVMVCRQNYSDIRGSSFEGILGSIYDLGFEKFFKWTTQPLEITYIPFGTKIVFRGMNNPTSIASTTFSKGYLTDIYIEEAFEIENFQDFIVLDGSLRQKLPPGLSLQITMMFNAWSQETWLYTEFFKGNFEDDDVYLDTHPIAEYIDPEYIGPYGKGLYMATLTYKVNEFRDTEIYDIAMEEMKKKDYNRYRVEALGCWGVATAAVYPAFNDSCQKNVQELLSMQYMEFAIGVDTGLSTAEGKKHKVGKNDDPLVRVRSATTMTLMGITKGYKDIIILDEYYHTNIQTNSNYNTDKDFHPYDMTQPELAAYLIVVIREWIKKYASYPNKPRYSNIMNGMIKVYVDSADIGFRQTLDLEARKQGLYNVQFLGGSKLPIQARVDFENALQHYGNFLVCKENCPNTIREFKNARRGDLGEARADGDDHCITALEYSYSPFWLDLIQRHNFKEH